MRNVFDQDQQFSKKDQASLLYNDPRRGSKGNSSNSRYPDQDSQQQNDSKNRNHQDRVNKNTQRLESMNQGAINPVQFYLQSAGDFFLDDEDLESRR
jgi:hypothetical protein